MLRNLLISLVILAIVRASVGQYGAYNKPTWEEYYRNAKSWEIGKIMNASADPCQDYYQFACGNWRTHYPASKSHMITGELRNALNEFYGTLSNLVNSTNSEDTASERMIKNLYKSCMHVPATTNSEYRRQMKKLIKEFGKMPMLEGVKWQQKNFDWLETVGKIWNKYGINILFQVELLTASDLMSNWLSLGPQKFVLTDISGPGIDKHKRTIEEDLINLLGIKKSIAKRTAAKIATFEATLVRAAEKTTDFPEMLKFNINQFNFEEINILKLMNISFGYVPTGDFAAKRPMYFEKIGNIVKKTPKATVANYIFYNLLNQFAATDSPQYRDRDVCIKQISKFFPLIVSKMTHRAYHLEETTSKYSHLWQEIATSLQIVLESDRLSWYDDENREFALEKLHSMKLFVDTFEDYDLDEAYSSLALSASDYMKNIKLIKSFNARKTTAAIDMKPDLLAKVLDFSTPLYTSNSNAVVLPVNALLSNSLMISSIPKALKYSRVGYLFGHEITHGFSGEGRFADRIGYRIREHVGDIEDEYAERKNCILDQYQHYEYVKTDRLQQESQDENIADIVGIVLAYQAYMRWLQDDSRTDEELNMETLPNLNYTNKQLFFIHYSQTWCADYTAEFDEIMKNDVHTIDPIRVVLPLVNFGEFARAFKCPVGSQMNPRKKCTIY